MEQHQEQHNPFESASKYYNSGRRKSFLFSRIAVFLSIMVLTFALTINVSNLKEQTSTQSRASNNVVPDDALPQLPEGCEYQQVQDGKIVVCMTPTPITMTETSYQTCRITSETTIECVDNGESIQMPLPTLPGGCRYEQSGTTYTVTCEPTSASRSAL